MYDKNFREKFINSFKLKNAKKFFERTEVSELSAEGLSETVGRSGYMKVVGIGATILVFLGALPIVNMFNKDNSDFSMSLNAVVSDKMSENKDVEKKSKSLAQKDRDKADTHSRNDFEKRLNGYFSESEKTYTPNDGFTLMDNHNRDDYTDGKNSKISNKKASIQATATVGQSESDKKGPAKNNSILVEKLQKKLDDTQSTAEEKKAKSVTVSEQIMEAYRRGKVNWIKGHINAAIDNFEIAASGGVIRAHFFLCLYYLEIYEFLAVKPFVIDINGKEDLVAKHFEKVKPDISYPEDPESYFMCGYSLCCSTMGRLGLFEHDEEKGFRYLKMAAEKGNVMAQYDLGLRYTNGCGVTKDEKEAFKWYSMAAKQEHTWAQYDLGVCYEFGEGVEKNIAEAVRLYKLAADQGYAAAQVSLGVCYEYGKGVEKNIAEAVRLYKLAADQGYDVAQYNLGVCYEEGRGVEKNIDEAFRLYKLAADQGNAVAQVSLGVCYEQGDGVEKDIAKAVRLYKLAADQGYAAAQVSLGVCYERGRGVEKNIDEAFRLYKLAADQGYAVAQFDLGLCYEQGDGVEKDIDEAVRLYKLAVDQKNAAAQNSLGLCYEKGKGVEKDIYKAVRLYKLAADQGNAAAQNNLGLCYEKGKGVKKDIYKAVRLFKLAADQGEATAQYNLGWCYEKGKGVEKDMDEAVRLYKLAAKQDSPVTKLALEKLEELQ